MKKRVGVLLASFMLAILVSSFVLAQAGGSRDAVEQVKQAIPIENEYIQYYAANVGVYIFGMYNLAEIESKIGFSVSIFILFLMVWLILFVGFSDILQYFSPFSPWASWLIGFGISVIAANIGMIQWLVIGFTLVLAVFGTIAIFVGIGLALAGFVALSWGAKWALDRKAAIEAHKGRTDIAQGIKTFAEGGRAARAEGGGHH